MEAIGTGTVEARTLPRCAGVLLGMLLATLLAAVLLLGPSAPQRAFAQQEHGAEAPGAAAEANGASAKPPGVATQAQHEAGHEGNIELPNWVSLLREHAGLPPRAARYLGMFENSIFAMSAGLVLTVLCLLVFRRLSEMPGRPQAFAELIVETVDNMVKVVMGPRGRHYTPFVGTLFLYLLFMNYSGLIPLAKAPTSSWVNNVSLSLCVFLYVQFTGIRKNGPWGYFKHLCGSPQDVVGWALSPLMLFLEIFGELIKPVSLSLRLFGNIFGEDMLLAIFAILGVAALSVLRLPIGLPLHFPFMLLSMLLGFIQAMVFSLLSTVYISLMLPHEEHGHEGQHEGQAGRGGHVRHAALDAQGNAGHGGERVASVGAAQPAITK
jgi:F-type H+-transporting ATPase subunit a